MLRSIKEIIGYSVKAKDGDIGKVGDFYFDDERWAVRYMVTDIGSWLQGKSVLISPSAFSGKPDWGSNEFPVNMSRDKVKNSPDVDIHKPVSRQKETEINSYFNWPIYWQQLPGFPGVPVPVPGPDPFKETLPHDRKVKQGDTHLRSFNEVSRYRINAVDGHIGHVEDLIFDDENWHIVYMVADTKNWLPGGSVLVAVKWLKEIDWAGSEVTVDLSREKIKNSPAYDPYKAISIEYEEMLYGHYGRKK